MFKNKFIAKIFSFIILLVIFSNLFTCYADDADIEENIDCNSIEISNSYNSVPSLNSRSAIVLERNSETILFGKNEFNKVKMASTTKIMTATIVIENCSLNETVTISKKAAGTGRITFGLIRK